MILLTLVQMWEASTPEQVLRVRGLAGDIVFLGKTHHSHSALSSKVYKWVAANLMFGANPAMD